MGEIDENSMKSWREKPRILIVDDDDEFISDLKILLSSEFDVDGATGTKRAREMIEEYQPDCLLLDLNMPEHYGHDPESEGLSFLKYIRSESGMSPFSKVPVIVLTARRKTDYLAIANQFGVTALYIKPPDIKRLKTSIWSLVAETNRDFS